MGFYTPGDGILHPWLFRVKKKGDEVLPSYVGIIEYIPSVVI